MSTSPCGNICIMPPKCSAKKEGVVSVTTVVLKQLCQGDTVFLGESKSTLFGLPKVDAFRNHYNRTAMHFMDDSFLNLGEKVILTLL